MSIRETLLDLQKQGKKAFIPFVAAGYPNLDDTKELLFDLEKVGADIIELGIPFSDPVADGVTIQKAYHEALEKGARTDAVLEMLKSARDAGLKVPVVLFSYLNPVYKRTYEGFIKQAQQAGANGALIVDLPPEEAKEYCAKAKELGFETVFLCSPTTDAQRVLEIDELSTGFVYYVARKGMTGARDDLPQEVIDGLKDIRGKVKSPLAVGFGISKPEHAQKLKPYADAIVVGSAIVALSEANHNEAVKLAESIAKACA